MAENKDREADLARREAALAAREAELDKEQAELEALRAAQKNRKTGLRIEADVLISAGSALYGEPKP